MKQRSLFTILCFILISLGIASVSAQQCMNNGNFKLNSTYDSNLRVILSSLPSNVTARAGFFFSSSIGKEPNRVYVRGMCIPGSTSDDCSACIKTASNGLIQSCPTQTGAFIWLGEPTLCHVRYSNSFFDEISTELFPRMIVQDTEEISTNLRDFTAVWEGLMSRMIVVASSGRNLSSSSNEYYTADVAALTPSKNIYALMQCTPDLTSHCHDCESCLRQNIGDSGLKKQGYIVMRASCFFRWELKTFSKAFENVTVASPLPPPLKHVKRFKGYSRAIVAIIVPIVVVTVFIIIILVLFARRNVLLCWKRKPYQQFDSDQSGITSVDSLQFDFKTIKVSTGNFSNKLGQGGFGEVFKGTMPNGMEVAVKRLSKTSTQGAQEFKNEVFVVAKLHHRNLVRLLGFCLEKEEKILVYEFVPNKSLDYFLFDPTKRGHLDWKKRYNIIRGITRGILYLHQDSRLTIIHRDLKASNILLDTDMNPKIADFGMARIFGMDQSGANTNKIVGTRGYMSPEYVMQGIFSMKSDVYSFGVLVLEIICGQYNSFVHQSDNTVENLVTHASRSWRNGSPLELVDSTISNNYESEEVIRCIHIALLCVQKDPKDRPTLSTIMLMLTSSTINLPDPQPPGFFLSNRRNQLREGLESSQSSTRSEFQTINEVTITDLYPR